MASAVAFGLWGASPAAFGANFGCQKSVVAFEIMFGATESFNIREFLSVVNIVNNLKTFARGYPPFGHIGCKSQGRGAV